MRFEILDEPSLVVANDGGDPDQIDAALERRRRGLLP